MFNPYRDWLGLAEGEVRSPQQLLGVASEEQDPQVLEEAALARAALVHRYQIMHPDECARLSNEIARALVTLLDPGAPPNTPVGRPSPEESAERKSERALTVFAVGPQDGDSPALDVTAWRVKLRPLDLADRQRHRLRARLADRPGARKGARLLVQGGPCLVLSREVWWALQELLSCQVR